MTDNRFSVYETLTIALAKTFRDGDVGFTGLTTGNEAVLYGTCIPAAAMGFARATHAPNLTLLLAGWSVNPDLTQLRRLPDMEFANELLELPSEAQLTDYPAFISYKRGDIDFGFSSGVQVDRTGSLNSVCIGPKQNPKVRLVGPILQPEHFTLFGREVIMLPRHDTRTFVEQVDYVSGVGHIGGAAGRDEFGLPDTGPELVITPLGIFDFDTPDRGMRVRSINPGVTREDIAAATGFSLQGLDEAPETKLPTDEEIHVLREKVDPCRVLIPSASDVHDRRSSA
ncbi:CoA-transferase [Saccharopolyspora tripterygii]